MSKRDREVLSITLVFLGLLLRLGDLSPAEDNVIEG